MLRRWGVARFDGPHMAALPLGSLHRHAHFAPDGAVLAQATVTTTTPTTRTIFELYVITPEAVAASEQRREKHHAQDAFGPGSSDQPGAARPTGWCGCGPAGRG